jgi:hypothetical protein
VVRHDTGSSRSVRAVHLQIQREADQPVRLCPIEDRTASRPDLPPATRAGRPRAFAVPPLTGSEVTRPDLMADLISKVTARSRPAHRAEPRAATSGRRQGQRSPSCWRTERAEHVQAGSSGSTQCWVLYPAVSRISYSARPYPYSVSPRGRIRTRIPYRGGYGDTATDTRLRETLGYGRETGDARLNQDHFSPRHRPPGHPVSGSPSPDLCPSQIELNRIRSGRFKSPDVARSGAIWRNFGG